MALALAGVVGLLWIFQRSLVYLPSDQVPAPPPGVEEVHFETEDGLRLAAWHVPAARPLGTVVVFNGNAGNRSHRLPLGEALARHGYSVLLTEYRGYGGNPGSPSEQGLTADARAALSHVEANSEGPIFLYGESLGAGPAIELALDEPLAGLVLRSPFASLPDVAAVHYPWLPTSLLLKDRYPNRDRIGDLTTPALVITGTEDRIVPFEQSRQVYEAAGGPKDMLVIEDAGHNDRALLDGEEMISAVVAFLDEISG